MSRKNNLVYGRIDRKHTKSKSRHTNAFWRRAIRALGIEDGRTEEKRGLPWPDQEPPTGEQPK